MFERFEEFECLKSLQIEIKTIRILNSQRIFPLAIFIFLRRKKPVKLLK